MTACKNRSTPEGIIPRDRMVDLLVQVHIVDGYMISKSQQPDTLYKYGMAKYMHLFQNFHTDTAQFKRSTVYYANQPELFDQMYDEVTKQLAAKVDSLSKVRAQIAKQDSAKNAQRTKHLADSAAKAQQSKVPLLKKGEMIN
ncbi:DUF4296 domain-containing protein [Mucilaginibacter ginkgonis]|uniref:DUF4296 domain-containing protein n=1 Tax=Mucilaginibacter ginkgonis TaxID=2682091 RepID=A0A7T7FDC8_9SPHI|nr:DUF4296 domain-containing protein [Mucilaginibacter ginkgonis]QQL51272.1 DUF4296 domain-containing protein [Mucilaginibacter ginkgonis]